MVEGLAPHKSSASVHQLRMPTHGHTVSGSDISLLTRRDLGMVGGKGGRGHACLVCCAVSMHV